MAVTLTTSRVLVRMVTHTAHRISQVLHSIIAHTFCSRQKASKQEVLQTNACFVGSLVKCMTWLRALCLSCLASMLARKPVTTQEKSAYLLVNLIWYQEAYLKILDKVLIFSCARIVTYITRSAHDVGNNFKQAHRKRLT